MLALSASRLVDPDDQDFFSLEKSNERYLGWVKDIMDKFGYKTKKSLFKKMNSCSITQLDGMITFRPTIHEKLEGWSGDRIDEKDYVVISDTSSSEDIGAAL
ncbi:Immunity protein CdiI-o11 [Klebsiella spallanzanii]|uniref:Immunity protein CdiI-o11 n=2 Tax=Klebsiella spallanzanii TaxID=2587528 RepID=A0ABY6V3P9_9ENTR|nr:Immunity protein CdiI-o11 [Klebsiella spallanzanii]